jgi:hypothetical protein
MLALRRSLVLALLTTTLGCAARTASSSGSSSGSSSEPSSDASQAPIAEFDGQAVDDERCEHYLADAPPPLPEGEFMPISAEEQQAANAAVALETRARCAHYLLIHRVLAQQVLTDPRIAVILWAFEDPLELLEEITGLVNEICAAEDPNEWQMPRGSFRIGRTELLGRPVVVIDVIPPPVAMTEAYMFALVGRPWADGAEPSSWTELSHYFVLEHNVNFPNQTVVGGWVMENGGLVHLNMGAGPQPTPAGFVHVIGQNLCANYIEYRTRV